MAAEPIDDVVFDLDGTLVDSRPGIDRAGVVAVAEVWPDRRPGSLARHIGPPVREMLARAYPDACQAELDSLQAAFRSAYDGGEWQATELYPAVAETLAAIVAGGRRCFVVTNKPRLVTGRLLDHLGLSAYVTAAYSPDGPVPFTAKADALAALGRGYAVSPRRSIYVGDAAEDRVAAQLAGLRFVPVSYGYGDAGATARPTDLLVLNDLPSILGLMPA